MEIFATVAVAGGRTCQLWRHSFIPQDHNGRVSGICSSRQSDESQMEERLVRILRRYSYSVD